jgi:halocyanin-like protein
MNRREFTAAVGLVGTGLLAGCVSDDGSDTAGGNGDENGNENGDENGNENGDEESPTPTEEPTTQESDGSTNGDGGDDSGGDGSETDNSSGNGPVAVVETFLERYRAGEAKQINRLLHPEGPDPVSADSAAEFSKLEFSIETIEVTEQTEDRAVVDVSFSEQSAEAVRMLDTVVLRPSDGEWRIYSFETNQSQQRSPNAAFEFEQKEDTLTITHTSGDSIPADELSIRGDGLATTGSWDALGGETDDEGNVTAGLGVSVPVTNSTVEVQVVWESSDSDASATLAAASMASESVSGGAPEEVVEFLSNADVSEGVVDWTDRDEGTVVVGGGDDGLSFTPAIVRITPGTTVVWEWSGEGGGHNVVETDGAFESELGQEEGVTFEHTFEESGAYLYYCAPHRALGMKGAVIVE